MSSRPILEAPEYSGLRLAIRGQPTSGHDTAAQDEVDDDIEGEKETIDYGEGDDEGGDGDVDNDGDGDANSDGDEEDDGHEGRVDEDGDAKMANLHSVIKEASKGVVDSTDAEYKRLHKLCEKFAHAQGFLKEGENFFTNTPHSQSAVFIVAWIMNSCDDIRLDGKTKDSSIPRDSYSHAQKMRAAATYGFGRLNGLGSLPWQKSEVTGKMVGNPSISEDVSRYMVSLRKKKVRVGEVATSARAITPKSLHASIITITSQRSRKSSLSRVTSQYGEIKPFVLHELPEDQAHVCPVRALTAWLACSRIDKGYLFPTITIRDQIGDLSRPMKSEKFLEMFRNNLLDIGLDPYPYGTHSFRRGGCQYFASHRRWSLRRILFDWME
ncbi:DNA breaking-rejoining enzyme [Mycena venus]|uniref:DNA breaking-rejoining enzyme n=1 Tax=Mycena venus TaxID=2733690 RepID=A0A8H6XIU5_9AGAR|nr:DNA breaking-rejoining enzyme [Mycena venus]